MKTSHSRHMDSLNGNNKIKEKQILLITIRQHFLLIIPNNNHINIPAQEDSSRVCKVTNILISLKITQAFKFINTKQKETSDLEFSSSLYISLLLSPIVWVWSLLDPSRGIVNCPLTLSFFFFFSFPIYPSPFPTSVNGIEESHCQLPLLLG